MRLPDEARAPCQERHVSGKRPNRSERSWYRYYYKVGNKIRHSGITQDLERREREHQQRWLGGHIVHVGNATTEEAAREWEETKQKMDACLIGVDCAVEDANMGVACGHLTMTELVVREAAQCARDRKAIDTIVRWLDEEKKPALLAIDAPLGWPVSLPIELGKHSAGQEILTEANALFRRYTDRFIPETVGKTPLDVGADRIARTAYSALTLLGALRRRLHHDIPLAWSPEHSDRIAAIEVYPAATLLAHSIKAKGYKQVQNNTEREDIINALRSERHLPSDTSTMRESADALDAVVCLLAGADFLRGQAMPPSDFALAKKEGWIWVRRMPRVAG